MSYFNACWPLWGAQTISFVVYVSACWETDRRCVTVTALSTPEPAGVWSQESSMIFFFSQWPVLA